MASQNHNVYDPQQQVGYAGYPQQPGGFAGYPQQPGGFAGYPQQPVGFAGYPQQQGAYGGQQPYPPASGKNSQLYSDQGPYGEQQSYGDAGAPQIPFIPPVPKPFTAVSQPKDDEQGNADWGNFNGLESKEIRRVFIRKVYLILMIQLSVTFGFIALCHFTEDIKTYVKSANGRWAYWASYIVFFVTYITLACCRSVGRRFPLNLVLLSLLTLSMSYMMGMISAFYRIDSVLIAVGITAVVCLAVTLFSFQTKYDFTSCMGVLFVVSIALMGFGIVCIFTRSQILYTVYAGAGAVIFSIFLAVDTQLIMGGKRHEISAEDHIFASIMLYLDIIYIFMFLLSLFGKRE